MKSQSSPSPAEAESASDPAAARGAAVRILVLGIVLVALYLVAQRLGDALPVAFAWVEGLGVWGPLAFIALYAIGVVAFIPGSILTLASGALFGLAFGTLYAFSAAMIGSGAAFLIARYLARGFIEHRIEAQPRFAAIDRAIADQGLRIVFLLRLSPLFPFNFMNYALGLTRVRFADAMLAGFGMIPGTLLYVYYGKAAGDLAKLAAGVPVERDAAQTAMLALGLVATIAVTTVVTRLARKALAESTETSETGNARETADARPHESETRS